jgi:hypothetical protein
MVDRILQMMQRPRSVASSPRAPRARSRLATTAVGVSLLVFVGALGTLAGCGQKGPLTLPSAAAASAPAR